MRRLLFLPIAACLTACPAQPTAQPTAPAASPTPIVGTVVNPFKIVVMAPVDGVITVLGKPDCVYGGPATTVTLTVLRETATASPAPWRLTHLGGGLPIASSYATVAADGGFAETRVGDPARPVRSGDELNVTPQNGITQSGFPVAVKVP